MTSSTDRIEKKIRLKAARARVWRALTDAKEFGAWFGVELEGPFVAGETVRGKITHPEHRDLVMEVRVERIEPERVFAYRWHPAAVDPNVDYGREPTTLVEFTLADSDGGTLLTLVESGFDAIPEARRATALRMNDGGWTHQMESIARYVG